MSNLLKVLYTITIIFAVAILVLFVKAQDDIRIHNSLRFLDTNQQWMVVKEGGENYAVYYVNEEGEVQGVKGEKFEVVLEQYLIHNEK